MSSILTAGGLSLLLMSAGDLVNEVGPQTAAAQQVDLLTDAGAERRVDSTESAGAQRRDGAKHVLAYSPRGDR
jgi:hypothetical protein